ncbi:MAG: ROK family transcriptional regulator, partial [Oscillospiraceae bacterium]
MIKASKDTMKSINKENVLNSFINRDVLSKSDISDRTKLCSATVSNLIAELVKEGLVQEKSMGTSSGGRKPMLYALNGELAYVLSIRVTPKGATAAIINLKCKIVQSEIILQPVYGVWGLSKLLTHVVSEFYESYPDLFQRVIAVAVSLPGIMQFSTRTVIYSAPLGIEDVDVGEIIDQISPFPIKTYIFKDTDALILGEYHFSDMPKYKNVAYILCENGVGFSLILQETLFSRDGCGLELGHQTIDINAKPCKCSMPGCVGTLLSEAPAVKRYLEIYEKQRNSFISLNSLNYDDLI